MRIGSPESESAGREGIPGDEWRMKERVTILFGPIYEIYATELVVIGRLSCAIQRIYYLLCFQSLLTL